MLYLIFFYPKLKIAFCAKKTWIILIKCFLLQRFEGLMLKKQVSPLPFHILGS